MTGSVPPAAAARLLAGTAELGLLVGDGRIVRSGPDALPPGLPLAQLVHPDDDLPLPPPPGTVARLRLQGGDHRWCEVTGTQDPGGTDEPGEACWLAVHDAHQRIERERDLERRLRQTLQAV